MWNVFLHQEWLRFSPFPRVQRWRHVQVKPRNMRFLYTPRHTSLYTIVLKQSYIITFIYNNKSILVISCCDRCWRTAKTIWIQWGQSSCGGCVAILEQVNLSLSSATGVTGHWPRGIDCRMFGGERQCSAAMFCAAKWCSRRLLSFCFLLTRGTGS